VRIAFVPNHNGAAPAQIGKIDPRRVIRHAIDQQPTNCATGVSAGRLCFGWSVSETEQRLYDALRGKAE
jgi:hypothetical protein